MKVFFATSEVVPFAKTGGLADVSGALPRALAGLGVDVKLIMPLYRSVRETATDLTDTGLRVEVPIGDKTVTGELWQTTLPDSDIPVYCLAQSRYYGREGLYGTTGVDPHPYPDNCERFVFFSRCVIEALLALDLQPDVLHLNDWQSALAAVYLKALYQDETALQRTGTLMTVHNLLYQGIFSHWDMLLTGLGWAVFNWRQLEFYGKVNLLKGGLVFADYINTVSPTYAREIQTPAFGNGLDGVLAERRDRLLGIVNGIDTTIWNPETDPHVPAQYSAEDPAGKAVCKAELQKENDLPVRADAPLIGMVSRLVGEKGVDLVLEVLPNLCKEGAQFVLLGTGEPEYHEAFTRLAEEFPRNVAADLTFNNPLAHRIEAGADMFLMPSRFEPCGLNQLYSLRYGTVPVVRRTGGLADTITDYTPEGLSGGEVNGFSFTAFTAEALGETLQRAVSLYRDDRESWKRLLLAGMKQDWSWTRSARDYCALYEKVAEAGAARAQRA